MSDESTARVDWKRSYYAEADQSDALRKECEALRKDAERYRWLRSAGARMGAIDWGVLHIFPHDLAALDCRIDASIALRRDGAA